MILCSPTTFESDIILLIFTCACFWRAFFSCFWRVLLRYFHTLLFLFRCAFCLALLSFRVNGVSMNGLSVCFRHFFTGQFLLKISVTICWKVLAFVSTSGALSTASQFCSSSCWLILILAPGVTFLFVILSYCTGFLKAESSTTDSWSLFPIGGERLHRVLTYSGILVYILSRCAFSLVGKSTICVRPRACSSDEVLRSLKSPYNSRLADLCYEVSFWTVSYMWSIVASFCCFRSPGGW